MNRGSVTCLVGAQFGSEGKGAVAAHIAHDYEVHVRTGGPNAGHTVICEGRPWKMRSVPCGWMNGNADLVIGAGAVIDRDVLTEEVEALEDSGYFVSDRLWIDPKAVVISPANRDLEGGTTGLPHKLIGSTGEGVGVARMAHISRGAIPGPLALTESRHVSDYSWDFGGIVDTGHLLEQALNAGRHVLLEGTQGMGLSSTHGEWPFVTSHDTSAAQLCADAGLSPLDVADILLVARTFPIRVAGNSGPLFSEVSWEDIGQDEERTTVTNKVRRVGRWDEALFRKAMRINKPTGIALTFADYIDGRVRGKEKLTALVETLVKSLEESYGIPVFLVGTGPASMVQRYAELGVRT